AQVAVGAFAIRVSRVYRAGPSDHFHQRIPKTLPLEQTLARRGFARNFDGLADAAQGGARAMRGGERARWVGIGERRQQFAQVLQASVPSRPAKPRSAA